MNILECRNLNKAYKKGVNVLQDFNVTIPSGRIVGLLGPNGCGKSTLIKTVAGLLVPTSGEVLVDGKEVNEDTKAIVSFMQTLMKKKHTGF